MTSEGHSTSISQWFKRLLFGRRDGSIKDALEDAIDEVLEEREEGAEQLAPEETEMLRNVLSFGDIAVGDIMVPRSDILAVPHDITLDKLKAHCLEQRHTRTPVYRDSLDHIEGFVHVKDLFGIIADGQPFDLKKIIRPLLFVPPSMKVIDLLVKMRRTRSHMAIVVDEYGGTDGLLTLEDVFEEIVGDIRDEHDEEDAVKEIVRLPDGSLDVDARIRLDRLEEETGLTLLSGDEDEEFDTLGGLVVFLCGKVPARGEVINQEGGLRFEILEADQRRIRRVRIVQSISQAAAIS